MIGRKSVILSVSVIAILVFSTVFVTIPAVPKANAQQKPVGANWEMEAYDNLGQNFNPQTQITKDNVRFLEMKWIFPFPRAPAIAGFGSFRGEEGSLAPPLVVDGIVYVSTGTLTVFALDAKTGKLIWTFNWFDNFPTIGNDTKKFPIGAPGPHVHAINYFNGYVVIPGFGCRDAGLDATTGKVAWFIEGTCNNVPGNVWPEGEGRYLGGGFGPRPAALSKRANVLIVNRGGDSEGAGGGRAFMAGYDFSKVVAAGKSGYNGPPLWRTFLVPPAEGDPEWALRNCDKGWFFDYQAFKRDGTPGIPCSSLPRDLLLNDWGKMRFNSGMSGVWGQFVVDEETGIFYVGTSQPGPDWNATYRPGPNVYSDSIVAFDSKAGNIVWWYQARPHDLFDQDCSWNPMLAKATIKGRERKVLYKTCKDAKLFALDAATGEPYWVYGFPDVKFPQFWDPVSLTREGLTLPWANYPSKDPFWTYASPFEADSAFAYNTIYSCAFNWNSWGRVSAVEGRGAGGRTALPDPYAWRVNSTLSAIDASSGKLKWSFFVDAYPCRGGPIVSGGMVYFPSYDGNLYMLNADTGALVDKRSMVSTGLGVRPTIAADADGKMKVFQILSSRVNFRGPFGANVPGGVAALGLPDKLPEPQIITKEVIKEVPKEVIKEVPKEVTKTVTVETISPITYVGIGVGIIGIVIGAVISRRRQKVT